MSMASLGPQGGLGIFAALFSVCPISRVLFLGDLKFTANAFEGPLGAP